MARPPPAAAIFDQSSKASKPRRWLVAFSAGCRSNALRRASIDTRPCLSWTGARCMPQTFLEFSKRSSAPTACSRRQEDQAIRPTPFRPAPEANTAYRAAVITAFWGLETDSVRFEGDFNTFERALPRWPMIGLQNLPNLFRPTTYAAMRDGRPWDSSIPQCTTGFSFVRLARAKIGSGAMLPRDIIEYGPRMAMAMATSISRHRPKTQIMTRRPENN